MAGSSLVAPHPTIANLYPMVTDSLNDNLILFAKCTGTPDTTANVFSHGCILIQTDTTTGQKAIWENVGSSGTPSWNLMGSITAGEITLAEGKILVGNSSGVASATTQYGSVAKKTNGTTPVNIFGTTNGFPGSLVALEVISADDTSANITVATNTGTVAVIAKGSTGVVTGSSIAVTGFTSAGTLTAVSDSASGNATVVATFIS